MIQKSYQKCSPTGHTREPSESACKPFFSMARSFCPTIHFWLVRILRHHQERIIKLRGCLDRCALCMQNAEKRKTIRRNDT